MKNEPINIFKYMYVSLSIVWKNHKEEKFDLFLAEADPFITGDDSADPAIFDSFKKRFMEYGNYDEFGYSFIIKYLAELDSFYGDILKFFLIISKEEYLKNSQICSELSDEDIINQFDI